MLVKSVDASLFTLTNTSLVVGTMNVVLDGLEDARLTDLNIATAATFDASGWTGAGKLATLTGTGNAGDVVQVKSAFSLLVLKDTQYTLEALRTVVLANIDSAYVEGLGGSQKAVFNDWTKPATFIGGDGSDIVVVARDVNFTAANNLITIGTTQTISLPNSDVEVANLAGVGTSNNTFDYTGWSGTGTISAADGTADRVKLPSTPSNETLTPGSATVGTKVFSLAGVEEAELLGNAADNTFTLLGWAGVTVVNGGSAGIDTLVINGNQAIYELGGTTAGDFKIGSNAGSSAGIDKVTFTLGGAANTVRLLSNFSTGLAANGLTLTPGTGTNIIDVLEITANANFLVSETTPTNIPVTLTGTTAYALNAGNFERIVLTGTGTRTISRSLTLPAKAR